MTSGTIREAPDLVFFHQPRPQRALVLRGLIRIVDLEDILPRPDVTFRMPMAIQAPFHLQALCAPSQRHGPHGTVARGAAYSLVHMNAVVEIDEIRQTVHLDPLDGFIASIALTDWVKVGGSTEQNRMAVHTNLRWGNSRISGGFHARVAVSAVDPVVADMVFVAKLHRLRLRDELIGHVRRTGG